MAVYHICLFGITAGVHRLWSHRAYKAKLPLRILLAICNSVAYQNSIYEWARDHRVHHKYSETNADPVNIERGFFFAHVGWLLCKKHPDVTEFGKRVDLSDILADPVVYYQKKYYIPSVVFLCFLFPAVVPWYFWAENFWTAFFVASILRYTVSLNSTWLVNSAAHMFGYRPYDINIAPAENKLVSALTLGKDFVWNFPVSYLFLRRRIPQLSSHISLGLLHFGMGMGHQLYHLYSGSICQNWLGLRYAFRHQGDDWSTPKANRQQRPLSTGRTWVLIIASHRYLFRTYLSNYISL